MPDDSTDDQPEQDRRQLILPHIDTSISIKGKTVREWLGYLPAGIGLSAAVIALLLGQATLAGVLVAISATALVLLGVYIESELAEAWYLTPRGVVDDYLSYRRLQRELPWGAAAAKYAALHGVRHVCEDGSYKRHDGSRLALVGPIKGVNADRRPAQVTQQLSRQLTNGVDDLLAPRDLWWGIYSTTRPGTSDPHAIEREQRAADTQNALSPDQREIVEDTAEWLRTQDARYDGNEWRHYAVVEARPGEAGVRVPTDSLLARLHDLRDRLLAHVQPFRDRLLAVADRDDETADTTASPTDETATEPEATNDTDDGEPLDAVLARRVSTVEQAISRVEDVELSRAEPAEHIEVLRSYWTNRGTAIGDAGDGSSVAGGTDSLLQQAFTHALDGEGVTSTERLLADGEFDVDGDTVRLAGKCCRTFWISHWPIRPGPMFLDSLYTASGIDLDVRIHAVPISHSTATTMIEDEGIDIGAETINRAEESSFGALSVGSAEDAYKDAYQQLHTTGVSPWELNGYITVRADDRSTLDDVCEALTTALEANPTGCSLVASSTNQRAALASASPAGHDLYAEEADGDRRHLALSGAFGALFPFSVAEFSESDGIYWGRDTRTNRPVVANLFDSETASHLFTIGTSRTGKTTFIKDRLGDWYLAADDRTLIVADTEAEFGGLTDICDGVQTVIGGTDSVNPWHIEPVAEARRRKANDNLAPLAGQIDFLTELTMSIIRVGRPQGASVDANLYAFVRYVVAATYERADITSDLDTHANPSPTYDDFLDMLYEIRVEPDQHTFHGTDGECQARIDLVDTLLNSLIEMLDDRRYAHLRGEGTTALLDDDVRMAYTSMPHLNNSSKAEKSIGLQLALSQIGEKIKRTPGPTIFVIDEAHVLYQTESTINWLQSAARRWARYDAAMWSVSQSPEEFVTSMSGTADDQENKRQMILEQSATLQAFKLPRATPDTLAKFDMKPPQITAAKSDLVSGKTNDHSTCLVQFDDLQGWLECRVETSPVTDAIEATRPAPESDEQTDQQSLTTLDGLDTAAASQLAAGGIETREDLLATDARELAALTTASGERIDDWYDAALARNGTAADD